MSINPINNHVLISPIKRESPVASLQSNYDEKGIVLDCDAGRTGFSLKKGIIVYFDSWQAAKFEEGTEKEFWLVPFSAIRATEVWADGKIVRAKEKGGCTITR